MDGSLLIVNAALTGMVPTKAQVPHLPETPAEIAEDCARVAALGASIVHLHAREHGRPTHRKDTYARIIGAVREVCPDIVVCVSCSGRNVREVEQRSEVLELEGDVKPDMASLTLGSLNFATQASENSPDTIVALAHRMNERGIRPELEAFEPGMVEYARYLERKGVLRAPHYFNLLLGSRGTASCTPLNLAAMTSALPHEAHWAVAGIGAFQYTAHLMAIAAGGHVRVGLEDNIWFDAARTELATNPALVERVVRIAGDAGRTPATPTQVRTLLGLASR